MTATAPRKPSAQKSTKKPHERAGQRVPEADRTAVEAHHAQAEREFAERTASAERFEQHRVADHDQHERGQHQRDGERRVKRPRGQHQRDEHEQQQRGLDEDVQQHRDRAAGELRHPQVEDDGLTGDEIGLFLHEASVERLPLSWRERRWPVDVDVFVAAHSAEWNRLGELAGRSRLTGLEADELVTLYQRAATHLSMIRSTAPDPALLARLSALVARGRSAVAGSHSPAWREVALFFTHRFPAAVYLSRRWWIPAALLSVAVMAVLGVWIMRRPAGARVAGVAGRGEGDDRAGRPIRDVLLERPSGVVRGESVDEQRLGRGDVPVPGRRARPAGDRRAVDELAERRGRDRPDVLGWPRRRAAGPAPAARSAGTDGGVHRGGNRSETRLDSRGSGSTVPKRGAGRAGPVSGGDGAGAGVRAAGVGRDRGVRDAVGVADVAAHRHRRGGGAAVPDVRVHAG